MQYYLKFKGPLTMKSILCDLNLHCTQHMISIHRGNMPQLLVHSLFRSFNLNLKKSFSGPRFFRDLKSP